MTKRLCNYKNKHVGKDSKDCDSRSQIGTALPAIFTKHLAKRKIAHATVYSNLSEKTEMYTPATTIQQLPSDFLILVISTRSIHSHRSKRINIKSNANSPVEKPPYINITQYLCYQHGCQIVMENNSSKSSADEKTNATLFIILTRCLRKYNNNCIYVIENP